MRALSRRPDVRPFPVEHLPTRDDVTLEPDERTDEGPALATLADLDALKGHLLDEIQRVGRETRAELRRLLGRIAAGVLIMASAAAGSGGLVAASQAGVDAGLLYALVAVLALAMLLVAAVVGHVSGSARLLGQEVEVRRSHDTTDGSTP